MALPASISAWAVRISSSWWTWWIGTVRRPAATSSRMPDLRKVYSAPNAEDAERQLELFDERWLRTR